MQFCFWHLGCFTGMVPDLLSAVSLLATFLTVCLFLCGVPICLKIVHAQSTLEFSALPFTTGVVGYVVRTHVLIHSSKVLGFYCVAVCTGRVMVS